ncbi:hypothetical protein FOH24_11955 [Acetobacter tropicalis]|uniref:Burkholderia phage Bcep781 gp06 n=1 Tax=Acetobacter tropicalis TaxID=104102 RepID=A0A094ZST2_9PROT|nr:hypothetical protein [Acetobacter tropicalis]KAA8385711.1 hypothetical protein FOH22_12630 [Acetobacter tropicalis]KAA8389009.1 hypothetical protein FOH24_11955 [Acetobacter tropicalis]KGB25211.1 hypothetical protein AtDm6_0892 [Acetobacter tropicalis]MBC9007546.1 hypothetical protein [Acetobacter tropicalis]MDO8171104.1 hypothetical protein [Acetobacter tropicalis]
MNGLFGIAAAATMALLPSILATLRVQDGTITLPDGSVQPCYTDVLVTIKVQAATSADLIQTAGLNQSSENRLVYLPGLIKGLNRTHQFGGDSLFFEGAEWLVTSQPETWGGGQWSKLLVTRQLS